MRLTSLTLFVLLSASRSGQSGTHRSSETIGRQSWRVGHVTVRVIPAMAFTTHRGRSVDGRVPILSTSARDPIRAHPTARNPLVASVRQFSAPMSIAATDGAWRDNPSMQRSRRAARQLHRPRA